MGMEIPREIEDRYVGKWIAWDTVTDEVVAADEDLDKVVTQAKPISDAGHELYLHHIVPPDVVLVGGW
jgi:hypothetical protein